jgi:hypothetical protein
MTSTKCPCGGELIAIPESEPYNAAHWQCAKCDGTFAVKPFDRAAWLTEQRRRTLQFRPKKGWVQNPLRGYPRNAACLCGSTAKWKQCCGPKMPLYIPESELAEHKAVLRGEL